MSENSSKSSEEGEKDTRGHVNKRAKTRDYNNEDHRPNENGKSKSNQQIAQARVARERASFFAVSGQSNDSSVRINREKQNKEECDDWCGPFSTARKLIKEREDAALKREFMLKNGEDNDEDDFEAKVVSTWKGNGRGSMQSRIFHVPTLSELCVSFIASNFECVEELGYITNKVRNQLVRLLCYRLMLNEEVLLRIYPEGVNQIVLPDCSRIDAFNMQMTLLRCKKELQVLGLSMCGKCFTADLVEKLVESGGFPKLTHLTLTGAYLLYDSHLEELLKVCPNLKHLTLSQNSRLGPSGLKFIVEMFGKTLETLSISMCVQLESPHLEPLGNLSTSLASLDLNSLDRLTDLNLSAILKSCGPNLRRLNLADCTGITDDGLDAIVNFCGNELAELSLFGLICLSPEKLRLIFEEAREKKEKGLPHALSRLSSLSLGGLGSEKVGNEVIRNMAISCSNVLVQLNVNSSDVGDAGLVALTQFCGQSLRKFEASFCHKISNKGLGYFVDCVDSLEEVEIWGNMQINGEFLRHHCKESLKVVGKD